ncbi:MAG: FMN-binding glutamate synthase family protein [Gemmatales bacterium]|nr:MAG: FMN-binding glutamate synthase family protein [Gemmatales bacterium]
MMRYSALAVVWLLTAVCAVLGAIASPWWFAWLLLLAPLSLLGAWDLVQSQHSLLRNYPLLAHFRWLAEMIRPEIYQYFIESDVDGRPFDRDSRSLVYERAKNSHGEYPFGTELDVYEAGYEWFNHSIAPVPLQEEPFRVPVGGPQCKQPYQMALLNISAMSFGALSSNAILALNLGARLGGFAHDTGEGGLTKYHLKHGGDLIWEIGSGYFGCRTRDGNFDLAAFRDKSQHDHVKCVSLKLSQGAKPGLGGVMPAAKVTPEIAEIRGVPAWQKCVSPSYHKAFSTPRELVELIHRMRDAAGGKPAGFKLCVGQQHEFLAICKAMLELELFPDFIVVDGGEGGTGAAPLEFEDHIGTPLGEGVYFVHNALVGCGLRDKIRLGCSGKIHSAFEMARRIAQGADYCNAARAMMFALGCIQAQRCQKNTCPVGVATQDPTRVRALVVEDKAERVSHFQQNTVRGFNEIVAALGLHHPSELHPGLLMRRINPTTVKSYAQLYQYLQPGELLSEPPEHWREAWQQASPDRFQPKSS